jgi:two-component system, NtrC family, response regulator AtoC
MRSDFRLLVLDNDLLFCSQLNQHYSRQEVEIFIANSVDVAKAIWSIKNPNVVLLNPLLADEAFLEHIQSDRCTKIISLGISSNGLTEVFAHFDKPVDVKQLDQTVQQAIHDVQNQKKSIPENAIIGSFGNKEIFNLIDLAASVLSPVLITGETGTGKNLLARIIHLKSALHKSSFVALNCAALPESLMEAELFGHEKGAYTGAVLSKKGILEMANGGTLFLDEITDIPLHLQSKLLNVLEEKTVRRLGSPVVKPLNFRIIASSGNTIENVLGTSFRRDLYYRLNVLRIHLPPLRQRRDDIPELCHYFLKIMNGGKTEIPDSELTKLIEYDWPGNVRELKNVLERAYVFRRNNVLLPSEILISNQMKSEVWDGKTERRKLDRRKNGNYINGTQMIRLEEMERNHIQATLKDMRGNVTKTAKLLGISLSTMKRKIKEYGLKCWIAFLSVLHFSDLFELFLQ